MVDPAGKVTQNIRWMICRVVVQKQVHKQHSKRYRPLALEEPGPGPQSKQP